MKTEHLDYVIDTLKELQPKIEEFDKIVDAVGFEPEGVLCENMFFVQNRALDSLVMLIDDHEDWIFYFVYDCEWGQNPKEFTINGKSGILDSYDALRAVLLDDYGDK